MWDEILNIILQHLASFSEIQLQFFASFHAHICVAIEFEDKHLYGTLLFLLCVFVIDFKHINGWYPNIYWLVFWEDLSANIALTKNIFMPCRDSNFSQKPPFILKRSPIQVLTRFGATWIKLWKWFKWLGWHAWKISRRLHSMDQKYQTWEFNHFHVKINLNLKKNVLQLSDYAHSLHIPFPSWSGRVPLSWQACAE